jgi:prepilin-type N-terminal cleavage/methylation domain-containing protein
MTSHSIRRRAGFTLIELLVVTLVIGLLASIAAPRFANTKGKAYAASLRGDLHNLSTIQEEYFFGASRYSTSLPTLNFVPSPSVNLTIVEATATGWSATATHQAAAPILCAIYYGDAAPVPPATTQGTIACRY